MQESNGQRRKGAFALRLSVDGRMWRALFPTAATREFFTQVKTLIESERQQSWVRPGPRPVFLTVHRDQQILWVRLRDDDRRRVMVAPLTDAMASGWRAYSENVLDELQRIATSPESESFLDGYLVARHGRGESGSNCELVAYQRDYHELASGSELEVIADLDDALGASRDRCVADDEISWGAPQDRDRRLWLSVRHISADPGARRTIFIEDKRLSREEIAWFIEQLHYVDRIGGPKMVAALYQVLRLSDSDPAAPAPAITQ